jgi:large subunit ribosomal protein L21
MYAVFEDGSRQYVANPGEKLRVDFREVEAGNTIEFDRVLLYNDEGNVQIGQPLLAGARVVAEVIDHPSEKYTIQHFRRRKNYRRCKGHRQPFTKVEILHILLAGQKAPKEQK